MARMGSGHLHFFCGKMGSGKSTLAQGVARSCGGVLWAEDVWLSTLFPGQIQSVHDYALHASRLKAVTEPLAQGLLRAGVTLVLDFPGNTPEQRVWLKGLSESAGVGHTCWLVPADDALCLARIAQRAQAHGQPTDTADMFHAMLPHFSWPVASEGLSTRDASTFVTP